MQYFEHALVGIAFLIFLGVVGAVGLALMVKAVRSKPRTPTAAIYPIPPGDRGKHVTLLDLVEEQLAAEDARLRREKLRDKVYGWMSGGDPKSP